MEKANDDIKQQNTNKHIKKIFVVITCLCIIRLFSSMLKTDLLNIVFRNNKQVVRLFVNKHTNKNKTYRIIFLTSFYSGDHWFGVGQEPFENCSFRNCLASSELSDYNNSDAALVSMRHVRYMKQPLPTWRPPDQRWMMYMTESPEHRFLNYRPYNNLFNATITYRKNSDIYFPYGEIIRRENVLERSSIDFKSKSKMVAWFVSNCDTSSKRELYVKELRKYIQIDIFGYCGTFQCPRIKGQSYNDDICLQLLNKTYKFYLSFENSLCNEYITEKFWKILRLDVIPVVLGAANYSSIMPKRSFIDIKDFSTVKELAAYLSNMDEVEYNKYFEWKRAYDVTIRTPPLQCLICKYLNENEHHSKIYERLDLFWNRNSDCIQPKNYYQGFQDFNISLLSRF